MLNGDAGEVVTPFGRPLTATLTLPWNPFRPVAESVTGCEVLPGETEILEGEIVRLKFGEAVI
jgi:hypothetical protein